MEQLCSACEKLDLAQIIVQRSKVAVGYLDEIARRAKYCSFCLLIYNSARPDGYASAAVPHIACDLMAGDRWTRYWDEREFYTGQIDGINRGLFGKTPPRFTGHDTPYLRVATRTPGRTSDNREIGLVAGSEWPRSRCQFYERSLNPHKVDFDLVSSWYSLCGKIHGERCSEPRWLQVERPSGLRLIDVQSRTVVVASGHCLYSALSYVWGDPNFQFMMKESDMPISQGEEFPLLGLPKTIEDAMRVASELGLRYLWVDAVCIAQIPAFNSDKAHQLQQMDRIYKCAEVVIVAAASEGAQEGIHGVESREAETLMRRVQGIQLALSLPRFQDNVEQTTWNRRAWTYQELMLARRALVFGRSQAYWLCQCDSWRESVILEPAGPGTKDFVPRLLPDPSKVPERCLQLSSYDTYDKVLHNDNEPMFAYDKLVQEFTYRHMGYPDDGLNAISGVLQLLQQIGGNEWSKMHFGIPEAYFDVYLHWIPRTVCRRPDRWESRRKIPSWSWAGWFSNVGDGVIWDLSTISQMDGCTIEILPAIEWFMLDQEARPVPLPRYDRSKRLWKTTETRRPSGIDPTRLDNAPPPVSTDILPSGDGFLHFLTTSCDLKLGQELDWSGDDYFEPQTANAYALTDTSGRFAGTMAMPEETADHLRRAKDPTMECIFLSYSQEFDWPFKETWDIDAPLEIVEYKKRKARREWCIVNVMWITKDESGIAERMLIGKVLEDVWLAMNPRTEWIVLA